MKKKYVISILIILSLVFWFYKSFMPPIQVKNDSLIIEGRQGLEKNVKFIITIDTISDLPVIMRKINGYQMGNYIKGNFELSSGDKALFQVHKNIQPIIYMEYKRANKVYFNCKSKEETTNLFRRLLVLKSGGQMP